MEIQEEQRRKQVEAEMARLEKEAEERERQRRRQEQEDIQKKVAKDRLEQLKKSDIGKAFENVTVEVRLESRDDRLDRAFCWLCNILFCSQEIAKMDTEEILAKQVEQLERDKREMQEKLRSQEKKVTSHRCRDGR